MAKAKKLPSGAWRCRAYDYTDSDGKIHMASFTAATKKEAEYLAAEYAVTKKQKKLSANLTVGDAIDKYILSKENVLSPGTIREYQRTRRAYFELLEHVPLKDISNELLQTWVSLLSTKVSPKTVRNAHGLLSSALDMFFPDFRIKTTLPQKEKPDLHTPSDADVRKLLRHIEGKELEIAVLLAAFGPLRRGEICALESSDIHGNIITVNKSMSINVSGEWIIKSPKTYSSYRDVEFPDFVIEKLAGIEGRIIKATPDQITSRFRRAIRFSGVQPFRFHDLRHYSCSIMHALGVPDQYIMARGGWATDGVMKRVYRDTIDDQTQQFNAKIFAHFNDTGNTGDT